jgi:hypothetical protein
MGFFGSLFGGGSSNNKSSGCGCDSGRKDYGRGSSSSELCNSRAVADGLRRGSSESGRTMAEHRWSGRSKKSR